MTLYGALLLLCPASFRKEYGGEMEAVFRRRMLDASRPARIWLWMEAIGDVMAAGAGAHWDLLRQDLKYAVRAAAKAPAFTVVVIAVAALGVAAATSVFSIADHVLLRALPFYEPDRLVKLWQDVSGYARMDVSPANYRDWKATSRSFESMASFRGLSVNLSGLGEPERVVGASVNYEMFPILGVTAAAGRTFTEQEDRAGAAGTVVLSYGFWQRRFGGDPNVIGQRVQLDEEPFTVIGVMPANFHFPRREVQMWTAMRFAEDDFADRGNFYLGVIARLKPGVSVDEAKAEMRVVAASLERQYPVENQKSGVTVFRMRDELSPRSRTILAVLASAAFFVLLIACANLANLLLARSAARRKEIEVRTALGAGRDRLIRQLLTESLLLAGIGGSLGIVVASAGIPLLSQLVPSSLPISDTASMDWRVLWFAVAVTALTGIAFGAAPALRSTGPNLGLRSSSGARRERLRRTLVVAQVAASLALVISTGLLARALIRLENTDPGFATENMLAFRTSLPMPKYLATATRERFYSTVLDELRVMPGVRSTAVTSFRPMGDFRGGIWKVVIPGEVRETHASARFVTPGYFSTMRIPLLRGRDIEPRDKPEAQRVAVVSESFVEEHWPGENGLGRTFGIPFGELKFTIVGVVADVRFRGLESKSEPQMYFAHAQTPDSAFVWFAPKDFVVATSGNALALLPAIRRIVAKADVLQPVSDVQTLTALVEDETATRRTQLWVIAAFSVAAFLLAGIGIHGLLSFAVSQRTQEIGLRRALGAQTVHIASIVFGEALLLAIAGAAIGVGAAYLLGRSMEALLVGVAPADTPTLTASLVLALVMTLCGAVIPAVRAMRVDPAAAIRVD